MIDITSIKKRYDMYDWDQKFGVLRILSYIELIFGIILILIAFVLCAGILIGKIPLPYSTSMKIIIAALALIIGLVLGLGSLVGSLVIKVFIAIEQNTRYAMNVWLILEERDLGEGTEEVEPIAESEEYPVDES